MLSRAVGKGHLIFILIEARWECGVRSERPEVAVSGGGFAERITPGEVPVGTPELTAEITSDLDIGDLRVEAYREEQLELNPATCRSAIDLHGPELLVGVNSGGSANVASSAAEKRRCHG